ncbi:hypothetical protein Syun_002261 [Stephania yunnanensis]|uniref:C2 domain-containing protein n=1 Tax=Stephania yunnanensis TaxID=152371 RepID=A0AAP0LFG3_9MAGN
MNAQHSLSIAGLTLTPLARLTHTRSSRSSRSRSLVSLARLARSRSSVFVIVNTHSQSSLLGWLSSDSNLHHLIDCLSQGRSISRPVVQSARKMKEESVSVSVSASGSDEPCSEVHVFSKVLQPGFTESITIPTEFARDIVPLSETISLKLAGDRIWTNGDKRRERQWKSLVFIDGASDDCVEKTQLKETLDEDNAPKFGESYYVEATIEHDLTFATYFRSQRRAVTEEEVSKAFEYACVQAYLARLTFALAASPCSTPVLASILGYVAASRDPVIGGRLLLTYTTGYI